MKRIKAEVGEEGLSSDDEEIQSFIKVSLSEDIVSHKADLDPDPLEERWIRIRVFKAFFAKSIICNGNSSVFFSQNLPKVSYFL